jgi:hypothetical protein
MRWEVKFDEDNGMWLYSCPASHALNKAGYAVGGFKDKKTGVKTYTLHRVDDKGYPIIFETDTLDQLNAYINLILPPRNA